MHAAAAEGMRLPGEGLAPLPTGLGQGLGHPSTQRTNQRKQIEMEEKPPRLEEDRGSHREWGSLMNASGLEEGSGRGRPRKQRGAWRSREEKEQSCSLGQIFCCFIRFSVNQLVFARTGGRRGVKRGERAREEIRRTGTTSCPGLHFAVIICTNSS